MDRETTLKKDFEFLNGSWENPLVSIEVDLQGNTYARILKGERQVKALRLVERDKNRAVIQSGETIIDVEIKDDNTITLAKRGYPPMLLFTRGLIKPSKIGLNTEIKLSCRNLSGSAEYEVSYSIRNEEKNEEICGRYLFKDKFARAYKDNGYKVNLSGLAIFDIGDDDGAEFQLYNSHVRRIVDFLQEDLSSKKLSNCDRLIEAANAQLKNLRVKLSQERETIKVELPLVYAHI